MRADRFKVDNSKTVCRILPYFMRGRKLILLLEAIAHPLKSLHKVWLDWAEERIIEASITSQPMSLIWYLNHCFRKYFTNKADSFQILTNALAQGSVIYHIDERIAHEVGNNKFLYNLDEEPMSGHEHLTLYYKGEGDEGYYENIVIIAPNIVETAIYNNRDYEREIRKKVDAYITTQKDYQVKIIGNEGI